MTDLFRIHDLHTHTPVADADLGAYPRAEAWADGLMCHDMEGFAVMPDGRLFLIDECGNSRECPPGRFHVEWLDAGKGQAVAVKTCETCAVHADYKCGFGVSMNDTAGHTPLNFGCVHWIAKKSVTTCTRCGAPLKHVAGQVHYCAVCNRNVLR